MILYVCCHSSSVKIWSAQLFGASGRAKASSCAKEAKQATLALRQSTCLSYLLLMLIQVNEAALGERLKLQKGVLCRRKAPANVIDPVAGHLPSERSGLE